MFQAMMSVCFLLALACCAAIGSETKSDQDAVKGTWQATTAEFAGQKWPQKLVDNLVLTIDQDKYAVSDSGRPDKGALKFESNGKVKSMVIKGTDGPNNGKTFLAIYELNGDTLTICYDLSGKELPTEYKTKEKSMLFLVTYKRKKGD